MQGSVNALMLAMTAGFTWVGRGYAFDVKQLVALIQKAIQHPGLAYLDVLQPCPTYNDLHTKDWFAGKDKESGQPRVYEVQDEGYDPLIPADAAPETLQAKMNQFIDKAQEWDERIPTGVLLENRQVLTFAARLAEQNPGYRPAAPAQSLIVDNEGYSVADLSPLFAEVAIA